MEVEVAWRDEMRIVRIDNEDLEEYFKNGIDALSERRQILFWDHLAIEKLLKEGKIRVELIT